MNEILDPPISKAKAESFSKKLDHLLAQLRANNLATLEIRKDIARLKRSNDRSFEKAKKAVEALGKN